MQTYTHFVMTAALSRYLRRRAALTTTPSSLPTVETNAALLGSVAPDLPLISLGVGFFVWDRVETRLQSGQPAEHQSRMRWLFSELFFKSRPVKLLHNLFHAPLLTALYTGVGYWGWRRGKGWGAKLFSFGLAATLHTSIDIPIHHDDGPLLLFPFDWETRFYSPVSYWDPKRYGKPFALFEHGMLLGLLIWLWRQRRAEG